MSVARRALYRTGAVVLGLLAGLVLLEAGLWALSIVAPAALTRVTAAGDGAATLRVLCVGDSHTYGVLVRPDESYPARLRHHLRALGVRAQAWNLGVPGQNSRQVRNRLPGYLARYAPDAVVVFVGINNAWNVAERADGVAWTAWLSSRLRLVRFAHLLWAGSEASDAPGIRAEPADAPGRVWRLGEDVVRNQTRPQPGTAGDLEQVRRWTTEDLVAVAALARSHGATPVFVTYPPTWGEARAVVNDAIRTAAAQEGAVVIDAARLVKRLARGDDTRHLLFDDPGLHPRPIFYDELARALAERLAALPQAGETPDAAGAHTAKRKCTMSPSCTT